MCSLLGWSFNSTSVLGNPKLLRKGSDNNDQLSFREHICKNSHRETIHAAFTISYTLTMLLKYTCLLGRFKEEKEELLSADAHNHLKTEITF